MSHLEKKAYGPDSTAEEIKMLKSRVGILNDTTIYLDEVPIMSEFEIEITSGEIGDYLSKNSDLKYIVINLINTAPPDAKLREKLRQCYSSYVGRINYVAYYTGNNTFLNLIAKYMVRTIGYKKYSFHKTKEQALKAIEEEKSK